jgi:hypothetical protein
MLFTLIVAQLVSNTSQISIGEFLFISLLNIVAALESTSPQLQLQDTTMDL